MSTISKGARIIQRMTGWSYMFCLHLVDNLGFQTVLTEVQGLDEVPGESKVAQLGERLNERVKAGGKS